MNTQLLHKDTAFRRIVVGSTGLAIAGMLASLASIEIGGAAGLAFTWHWTVGVWMAAALLWNWKFWSVMWESQEQSGPLPRRKVIQYSAMLILLGAGAFLYPIRFIAEDYRSDIVTGLITAVIFLGTLAAIIYRLGRGFLEQDAVELRKQES